MIVTDREIFLAWRADVSRLVSASSQNNPPSWPDPQGSDLFAALDVRAGNDAVAKGLCTVEHAAGVIAARRLARNHGHRVVRDALALDHVRYDVFVLPRPTPRYSRENARRSA